MLLYYYPNRPTLIPADAQNPMNPTSTSLDELEKSRRWVAEQKWNGDNALIYTNTDPPTFWNRTHGVLKYKPTSVMLNQLKCIPKNSVVNGELVHSKTKTVKNLLAHPLHHGLGRETPPGKDMGILTTPPGRTGTPTPGPVQRRGGGVPCLENRVLESLPGSRWKDHRGDRPERSQGQVGLLDFTGWRCFLDAQGTKALCEI